MTMFSATPVVQPDLSSRPLCATVERQMTVSADVLFQAWTTEHFDRWFAAPGTPHPIGGPTLGT